MDRAATETPTRRLTIIGWCFVAISSLAWLAASLATSDSSVDDATWSFVALGLAPVLVYWAAGSAPKVLRIPVRAVVATFSGLALLGLIAASLG